MKQKNVLLICYIRDIHVTENTSIAVIS